MAKLISEKYESWKAETLARFAQLKANEEELNRIFIDVYGLQDELSPEVEDKDVTVYRIIDELNEEERKMRYVLSKKDAIITLISYAVGCMLGRYSLELEGLAYAGGEFSEQWSVVSGQYYRREVVEGYGCKALPGIGGVAEGHGPGRGGVQAGEVAAQGGAARTVRSDAAGGGVHPIQHSGGTGAELHEGVHPVSVHRTGFQGGAADANPVMRAPELPDAGTNQTGACPYRRSGEDGICTEAKAAHCPLTTDHFAVDLDGILPITDEEYFSDDIVTRFVDWVRAAYGEDSLEENLRFVADALGGSGTPRDIIRSYFLKDFYKDHVKTYKKRPIYWLFDSGNQNGFKALIYMHRYDRDTLGRVRVDYLHRLQGLYENAVGSCDNILASSASAAEKGRATKRREKLLRQLDECRVYDQALAHLAGQRIQIDLDDGVKHNYALFQGVELARDGRRAVKVDLLAKI